MLTYDPSTRHVFLIRMHSPPISRPPSGQQHRTSPCFPIYIPIPTPLFFIPSSTQTTPPNPKKKNQLTPTQIFTWLSTSLFPHLPQSLHTFLLWLHPEHASKIVHAHVGSEGGGGGWTALCSALEQCPNVRRIEVSGVRPPTEGVVKTILGRLSREDEDSERKCVVEVKNGRVLF